MTYYREMNQDRPIITVILPHLSLGDERRESGLQRCVDSLLKQSYGADLLQIHILNGDATVPEKVVEGVGSAKGDYVVFASNDIEFDENAVLYAWRDSVEQNKALVAFNGGDLLPDEGNICEHFMIRRNFISRLENSQIFSTDFHHTCVDNWLWAQAKKMNEVYRSERSRYVHHHFSKPGGKMDDVYRRGWSKVNEDRKMLSDKLSTLEDKKKLKIVVYAITKNEEKFMERFCDSAKDADEVVIIDTGSTDRTIQIAKECGATVHSIAVSPWRFDVARNTSLALLPIDADICMAIDADEIFEPGWREEIERVWIPGTTRLQYLYDWGQNIQFMCDKIHARKGYLWKHPCHELLVNDGRVNEIFVSTDKLLVRHLPDQTKSRGQYLDLLRLSVKEDPHCPRNSFYFARELTFYGKHEEAVHELKRYLALPAATWVDERAYAMRFIGKSLECLGSNDDALGWYLMGTQEAPHRRETWFALVKAYYDRKMWKECKEAAERLLMSNTHRNNWPSDPESWGHLPHDYLALASYYVGDKESARLHGKIALDMKPDDERLKKNMEWYDM